MEPHRPRRYEASIRLWDVCATIACSLVAFALLAPCLYAARQGSDLATCQDRLAQQGRAFAEYAGQHRGFPPRRTGFGTGTLPYGGWGTQILPYVDPKLGDAYRYDYDFYDPVNEEVSSMVVPAFVCPSAPASRVVTIEANATGNSANPNKDTLLVSDCGPIDYITCNVLFMPNEGYGVSWPRGLGGNSHQALTDNEDQPTHRITDGLSNTILVAERAGAPQSWNNGKLTGESQPFARSNNARGAWAGWGSIGLGMFDGSDGVSPAVGDRMDCTVNCHNFFGLYGFHEEGANVLLCDGSVRLATPSLDPLTLARLLTRDDGQFLMAGSLE